MLVANVLVCFGSIPLAFLNEDLQWAVYILAAFQGTGLFIMLNTATSLISDVIGKDTANSAFVYGCYSLFDKFANGFLMYFMIAEYSEDATALRYINSITPCIASVLAYVLTYLGHKWYDHKLAKLSGIN
jgi:Na+/melibiose symporter-like transporter